MMRKTYPLIGILLALGLALTGYQMAVVRAQPAPAGQIVICSGMGLLTVMVDSEGQPVARSHLCPDGVLTLFTGLGEAWLPPGKGQRLLAAPAFARGNTRRGAQAACCAGARSSGAGLSFRQTTDRPKDIE